MTNESQAALDEATRGWDEVRGLIDAETAEWYARWHGGTMRSDHEAWYELRARAPSSVDADAWTREMDASLGERVDAIGREVADRAIRRNELMDRSSDAARVVFEAIGRVVGENALDDLDADPSLTLSELVERAEIRGTGIRNARMDSRKLLFSSEGRFGHGLASVLGPAFGIAADDRRLVHRFETAMAAPAVAFVMTHRPGLEALSQAGARITWIDVPAEEEEGHVPRSDGLDVRVTVLLQGHPAGDVLRLLRATPETYAMAGPFRDPAVVTHVAKSRVERDHAVSADLSTHDLVGRILAVRDGGPQDGVDPDADAAELATRGHEGLREAGVPLDVLPPWLLETATPRSEPSSPSLR